MDKLLKLIPLRSASADRLRLAPVADRDECAAPRGDALQPHHDAVEAERDSVPGASEYENLSCHPRVDHADAADSSAVPTGRVSRALKLFGGRRALPAVLMLTVLIALPTLKIGFFADDYTLLAEIEHAVPSYAHQSPIDLYRFASDRTEVDQLIKDGPLPWFTDPGFKMHFCRPLTSLLFSLDHSLWGHFAAGYHVTSILLYVTLVLSVGVLLRVALGVRHLGPHAATATLAALLFAVDALHNEPAGWIASRHVMLAAIPATLGLTAHVRYVRDEWRPGAWLGPLGVIVALLGSETGLGAVACWLAFDAFALMPPNRSSARSRLLVSTPVLAIAAVYLGIYSLLDFGAGGNLYVGPTSDPIGFLRAAAERVPTLVGSSVLGAITDVSPATGAAIGIAAVLALFVFYRVVRPAIADNERATLRWLLPGALLSLTISSAGPASPRLLLFPSIATAFFLAVLLYRGGQQLATSGSRQVLRVGLLSIVLLHLVFAPIAFVSGVGQLIHTARQEIEIFHTAGLEDSVVSHVIVLAAPDMQTGFYPAAIDQALAPRAVNAWHILSMAQIGHRLTRTGASSFRLDTIGGPAASNPVEETFRSSRAPLSAGEQIELSGATVTVVSVDGSVPRSLDVRVAVPLDDPGLALLVSRNNRLVRLAPPPIGSSVEFPSSGGRPTG